jgi:hypothetical protein
MFFEVTVSDSANALVTSLQVDAQNWRSAFTTASVHAGGPRPDLAQTVTHVDGELITIFDGVGKRAITVRRLQKEQARVSELIKANTGAHPAVAAPRTGEAKPVGFTDRATGHFRAISGVLSQQSPPADSPEGRILSAMQSSAVAPAAAEQTESPWMASPSQSVVATSNNDDGGSALEDIFLESPAIIDEAPTLDDAAEKLLALALSKVPAEVGAVFLSEELGKPLVCVCAAGKNAASVQGIGLPFDEGFGAASLQTGLVISVASPRSDSRYTPEFASAGFNEENIIVAPVTGERAYGVMVFLNRKGKDAFSGGDGAAIGYVAKQLGEYIQRQIDAQAL